MSAEPTPAALRNAFLSLLDEDEPGPAGCELAGKLVDCQDPLPEEYCEVVDLPAGATFAQAAEKLRQTLGCPS